MKLNSNIRQTFRVAKIELSSMFYSPVAWLVLIIFALLIGYDYANVFDSQLRAQSLYDYPSAFAVFMDDGYFKTDFT